MGGKPILIISQMALRVSTAILGRRVAPHLTFIRCLLPPTASQNKTPFAHLPMTEWGVTLQDGRERSANATGRGFRCYNPRDEIAMRGALTSARGGLLLIWNSVTAALLPQLIASSSGSSSRPRQ